MNTDITRRGAAEIALNRSYEAAQKRFHELDKRRQAAARRAMRGYGVGMLYSMLNAKRNAELDREWREAWSEMTETHAVADALDKNRTEAIRARGKNGDAYTAGYAASLEKQAEYQLYRLEQTRRINAEKAQIEKMSERQIKAIERESTRVKIAMVLDSWGQSFADKFGEIVFNQRPTATEEFMRLTAARQKREGLDAWADTSIETLYANRQANLDVSGASVLGYEQWLAAQRSREERQERQEHAYDLARDAERASGISERTQQRLVDPVHARHMGELARLIREKAEEDARLHEARVAALGAEYVAAHPIVAVKMPEYDLAASVGVGQPGNDSAHNVVRMETAEEKKARIKAIVAGRDEEKRRANERDGGHGY